MGSRVRAGLGWAGLLGGSQGLRLYFHIAENKTVGLLIDRKPKLKNFILSILISGSFLHSYDYKPVFSVSSD